MKEEDIIAFGDALKTFGYGLGEGTQYLMPPIERGLDGNPSELRTSLNAMPAKHMVKVLPQFLLLLQAPGDLAGSLGEMLATIPTPITLHPFQLAVGTHMGTAACTTGNYTGGCNF